MALGIPLQSCGEDSLPLRRALVAGLFPHAAKRQMDGERRGAAGRSSGSGPVWAQLPHTSMPLACVCPHPS